MIKEVEVENIKLALQEGLSLHVKKTQFGLIEASLMNSATPKLIMASAEHITDEAALFWLDKAYVKKQRLCNFECQPLRSNITPRHKWFGFRQFLVGLFQDGEFIFQTKRIWDHKTIAATQGSLFVPTYLALDQAITDLTFKRADDVNYMFRRWKPKILKVKEQV